MELMYIYMKNYRNTFIEQEFNFSSEYRFKYIGTNQELNIGRNPLYIPYFFRNRNQSEDDGEIVNIIGIIGKNGAGKTTVLDFIKENLVAGAWGLDNRAIIIVKDTSGKIFIHYHTEIKINEGNYIEYNSFELIPYNENLENNKNVLQETTLIFYSTIFDTKREPEYDGIMNLSTNYLIKKVKQENQGQFEPDFSETELYRRNEIKKQLRFISSKIAEKIKLPFKLPNSAIIILRPLRTNIKEVITSNGIRFDDKFYSEILEGLNNNLSAHDNYHERMKQTFIITILAKFIYEASIYHGLHLDKRFFEKHKYDVFRKGNVFTLAIKLIRLLSLFIKSINSKNIHLLIIMDKLEELIFFINKINSSKFGIDKAIALSLNAEEGSELSIMKVLELHDLAMIETPFFEFDWLDLSSGQKALLSMYARFYSLTDQQQKYQNLKLKKDVLILIDEGELYLHPEWQRNFLNNLIDYFPKLYKNRKIKIIFTSNSPVIISDLPNSNLIFIDRSDKEKSCIVIDNLIENKQTFAANIHTLYSDAFFMEKGLIGEFANRKIINLIHSINSIIDREEFKKVEKQMEILISQIGEPVLRSKLNSMFKERRERFSHNDRTNQELLEMIRKMQEQIDQLKKEQSE